MTDLKILIKKELTINLFSRFNLKTKDDSGKRKRNINILLRLLAFIYLFGIAGAFVFFVIAPSAKNEAGIYMLSSVFFGMGIILLIFYVAAFISSIYYSNDVKVLMSLPLKKESIILSKSLVIGFLFYAALSIYCAAIWISYSSAGYNESVKIISIILLVIGTINLEIGIINFVVSALMRFFNRFRSMKYVLQVVGFLFIIAISIGMQFFQNGKITNAMMEKDFFTKIAKVYPSVYLLKIINDNSFVVGFLCGLLALVVGTLFLYFICSISSKMVFEAINLENSSDSKKVRKVRENTSSSVFSTIWKRDITNIIKTPIYIFNIGIGGLLFPICFFIPMFMNGSMSFKFGMVRDIFTMLKLTRVQEIIIVFAMMFLVGIFISSVSNAALTSITREGKKIWMSQTLPIPVETQINARIFASLILEGVNMIPSLLIMIYLLGPDVAFILVMLFASVVSMLFIANAGIFVGVLNPKLDWENPQQAVKRNGTVAFFQLGLMGYTALIGYVGYKFLMSGNEITTSKISILAIFILVLHIVLAIVANILAKKTLREKLRKYEY